MGKNQKNTGGLSLQDQLRNAGLVNEKQVRKAQKAHLRNEIQGKGGLAASETRLAAEQALAEKKRLDRELNLARNDQAAVRALEAEVRQLIQSNSKREAGDQAYQFVDGKVIKKIYVSRSNREQLNNGQLAIVKSTAGYDLVPETIARRILERSASSVLYLYERGRDAEDDPYKDFPIPDDLTW